MLLKFSKIIIMSFIFCAFFQFLFFSPLPVQAINDSMPSWKIPQPNLSIPIDTIKFTAPQKCGGTNEQPIYCVDWIGQYVVGLYKYAIGVVGILAAVILMVGGIIWITAGGSAGRIGEAKSWIGSALAGLVIALTSYLILYQINPNLVSFKSLRVEMPKYAVAPTPAVETAIGCCALTDTANNVLDCSNLMKTECEKSSSPVYEAAYLWSANKECKNKTCVAKPGIGGTGQCQPTSVGACSTSEMSCFGDDIKKAQASAICMAESGGNAGIGSSVDKCSVDSKVVSWGLFQINLSANGVGGYNCPNAFSKMYTGSVKDCQVKDTNLYNNCIAAATNYQTNIQAACNIYNSGGWNRWGANKRCGF